MQTKKENSCYYKFVRFEETERKNLLICDMNAIWDGFTMHEAKLQAAAWHFGDMLFYVEN
jgi:hypothetical protein